MAGNASTIKIEIQVDDKGGVKVVRQLGSESEKTGKKGKQAFSGMGKSIGSMNNRMATAHQKIIALAAAAISIGTLAMAIHKLSHITEEYVGLANVQEKVETRLAAVVRSTGGAAGFSADQLYKMAGAMQQATTIGDEVIIGGMSILTTFKKIRGEAFERATQAALDMADVMEGDLKGSIVMIGKALNDPIANLSAMSRAGVQFSDVQKETIKRLWEMGDAAGAQAIILDELESQFGGAAAAARERFGGSVTAAKNALGDMKEELGFVITKNRFFIDLAHLAEETFVEWGKVIKENREDLMLLAKDGFVYLAETANLSIKVLKAFHNALLGIELVANGLNVAIAGSLLGVYQTINGILYPMDLIYRGLVKIGAVKFNPFQEAYAFFDTFYQSTIMGVKNVEKQIVEVNDFYDDTTQKFDDLINRIKDIKVESAVNNDDKPRALGLPTEEEIKKAYEGALSIAKADKEILQNRLAEYRNFYCQLQSMIRETAEQEKHHVRELNQLYKQKADIQMSTEAMIRSLRETQMTPEQRYESQRAGLNKQYMAALQLSGQEQVQALEAYKQAVKNLATQFSDGIKAGHSLYGLAGDRIAVSSKEVIETAISDIQRAASVQQRALQDLAAEKERQVEADRVWKEELTRSAKDAAGEVEMLENILTELSARIEEMDRLIKIEGDDRVTPVVGQIQTALDSLHDKTVTITTRHVVEYASAVPVEGQYATGTRWVPKTGLYVLHKGEEVRTPGEVKTDSIGVIIKGDLNIIVPESAAPQTPEDWRMITRQYVIPELRRAGG